MILLSLAFVAWAGLKGAFAFVFLIIGVYIFGKVLAVCKQKGKRWGQAAALFGVLFVLGGLYLFKYATYVSQLINEKFGLAIAGSPVWTILGISFVSFSAISYIVDIYRGGQTGSLLDVALYLSFFPKVISGPIVLWKDFQPQIRGREVSLDKFVNGINLIAVGCAKKVILADPFGALAAEIQTQSAVGIDIPTAWGCAFIYMLQIYYDFSGYSDIAIGLSSMIGYDVKKNFDFPYVSLSITEFWRRWHISLGTWFREYVYIPLGGNRKGFFKTLRNLFVVFLLTGIWHGAGLGYLLWGITHGVCAVIERSIRDKKFYQKIPKVVKWAATMFVVFIGWQTFRLPDMGQLVGFFKIMLGLTSFEMITFTWEYYFTTRIVVMILIGCIGATLFSRKFFETSLAKVNQNKALFALQEVGILLLLILSVIYIVNSTYSPFIYFQY